VRHRISRLLAAGFFLSLVFHFGIAPLIVWLLGYKPAAPKAEVVYVATSSSITHAPRPRPRVARPLQRPEPPQPKPVAQTRPQPQRKPQPQEPEVKREIARIDRNSVHPPPAHAVALNASVEQQMFEKTIARLRQENNPLISAARATVKPQAPKRFNFDFSGSVGTEPTAEGILTPEKIWRDEGYDYYYVRYWVQYADGSTETGIVPWPLRYRPADDPFRLGLEHFPLPGPMPDYVLPAGTNLHPLVAFCYKHRAEFPNCPIEHD
jgi:hypothetical protein